MAGASPQWPGRVASLAEMAADFRQQLLSAGIDAQRRYWREEFHEVPSCRLSPVGEGVVALPPIPEGSRYSAMGPATTRS